MIPATEPVPAFDPATGERRAYDQWTPISISLARVGEGRLSASVRVQRSRLLAGGNTELLDADAAARLGATAAVEFAVPNVYDPPGEGYPAAVRGLVLQAAGAVVQAVAALGTVRGLL